MLGVIHKQKLLSEIFSKAVNLTEVYVDEDFNLEHWQASFYLLYKGQPDVLYMHQKLIGVYNNRFKIYTAQSYQNIMFEGKKLLWREGKWYL